MRLDLATEALNQNQDGSLITRDGIVQYTPWGPKREREMFSLILNQGWPTLPERTHVGEVGM